MTPAATPGAGEDAAPGTLVAVTGPSGVGKGTLVPLVMEAIPDSRLSVSVTTRPQRPDEADGVAYHFVDRKGFERLIADDALLEWAPYAGNLYGTPRRNVEQEVAAGHVVLLEIEVQGALQIRDRVPDALLVFVAPPSFEELERRLRDRGTEDDDRVRERLAVARRELDQTEGFDVVVTNDDAQRCADEIVTVIESHRAKLRR